MISLPYEELTLFEESGELAPVDRKSGKRNYLSFFRLGVVTTSVIALGLVYSHDIGQANKKRQSSPAIKFRLVKNPLHFFMAKEFYYGKSNNPRHVLIYGGGKSGSEPPDRWLISTGENNIYDFAFTREGSSCLKCHLPIEIPNTRNTEYSTKKKYDV
ncbi:MAG: hypothetical protein MUP55_03390 [Candidatus Aenigmarchaeota archaeon]|nr:hypothetical protein [Candidatus Aenigmarchaeota archaeon]